MTPEEQRLWREADRAFDRLLDLPRGDRESAVAALDDALRPLVQRLLRGHDSGALDATPGPDEGVIPRVVGGWALDEEIGRGGMAVVYRARRRVHGAEQRAAVKIMTVGALAADGRRRFDQEHAVLARMAHPRITALIDAGALDDGTPWLAMPLVEGARIDDWCLQRQLTPAAVVRLFLQVCDAVAHAHRHLVVHRDLKPGNVLVDGDGHAHLLDFGIARLLDDAGEGTGTRWRALTPEYAAPEQFHGEDSGVAIDVFGLGAVLYLLLTGRPPRRPAAGHDTRITRPSRAAAEDGRLPADLRLIFSRSLRGDLDLILLKALAHEPSQRYADVAAMADDLRAWLDHRPVRAARADRLYRARKFVARHRGSVAASLLIVAAVLAGVIGTVWQAQRAEREAASARIEAQRAAAMRDFLVSLFAASDPEAEGGAIRDTHEILRLGAQRLQDDRDLPVDDRADLLRQVGIIQLRAGDPGGGETTLLAALALFETRDDALTEVARTRLQLAELDYRTGRFRAAHERSLQALRELETQADPDRRLVIEAMARAGTGLAAVDRGDPRILDWLQRALALAREAVPRDLEVEVRMLHSLGQVYRELGRWNEAATLLREALDLAAQIPAYPQVRQLSTYWELSSALVKLQDADGAREAGSRALTIARDIYDPGHYRWAQALSSHGLLLAQFGDFTGSERDLRESVRILRQVEGMSPSRLATPLFNLATTLQETGRFDEAAAMMAEVQAIDEAELGPLHGFVLSGLTWRARILRQSQSDDATALFAEADARLRRIDPAAAWDIHVETAAIRLADDLLDRDRPGEALPWVQRAIERHHARGDGANPTLAWAQLVEARALAGSGQGDAARAALAGTVQTSDACADDFILDLVRPYLGAVELALELEEPAMARRAWDTFESRRGARPLQAMWREWHERLGVHMTP
ncbi:MAG TPA: serine/threonine-protein kinase [Xanthomonadaceae bacterium]|nr:serine/threonine-protein kinase [Xanthomonadaceae bacterium]